MKDIKFKCCNIHKHKNDNDYKCEYEYYDAIECNG